MPAFLNSKYVSRLLTNNFHDANHPLRPGPCSGIFFVFVSNVETHNADLHRTILSHRDCPGHFSLPLTGGDRRQQGNNQTMKNLSHAAAFHPPFTRSNDASFFRRFFKVAKTPA